MILQPPFQGRWADGLGLSLVGAALAVLAAAVVVLPQRLAQRPGGEGVLALHLDAAGTLRLWNRPIRAQELLELLNRQAGEQDRLSSRQSQADTTASGGGARPGTPASGPSTPAGAVLRLIPDAGVPWGIVQQAASGLERAGLPLELQLP